MPMPDNLVAKSFLEAPARLKGRVIAVGDIHGCSVALEALLAAIGPTPDDLMLVLGDVIDYGPDTRGVIGRLMSLGNQTRILLLTGNHEEMLFQVLDQGRDPEIWTSHGGDKTLESYGVDLPGQLPSDHLAFLRTAIPFYETDTHAFVHAGFYPNQPLAETPASALFWEFLHPKKAWPHYSGKIFVVGHTPQVTGEILDLGFVVCIDTDCSRGNWLTALDTAAGEFWQANQRGEVRGGRLHDARLPRPDPFRT